MYSINDIAAWFINKEPMSDKKLQKLSYYAVAWGWALLKRPIVSDTDFEAWVHGPVSPVLYAEYRQYGWTNIYEPAVLGKTIDNDEMVSDLMESVWETYGDKTGDELEALTHSELPWKEARRGLQSNQSSKNKISPETMEKFYSEIYIGD